MFCVGEGYGTEMMYATGSEPVVIVDPSDTRFTLTLVTWLSGHI